MSLRSFATDEEARAAIEALSTSLVPVSRARMKTPREIKKRNGMLRRIGCLGAFFGFGFLATAIDMAVGNGVGATIVGGLFLLGFPASLIVPTIIGAQKAKLWRNGNVVVATVTRANIAPAMLAPSQMHYAYATSTGEKREASFAAFALECPKPQTRILVAVDGGDDRKSVPLFDL